MLDMDGWGTYRKSPMTHGDPYTGISRFYLKLKAQLMPYIYTSAASAANIDTGNGDAGLPMIRAMLLSDNSEYAASTSTQYQYMFGENFLVAPVYQDTQADENGNDIRNGIYLPNYGTDENPTIWIDYFSGKQYRGGQVLNNYEAPLWKLPLFVKANAIVPMYAENNNPEAVSDTNTKGTDRSQRIVEFFATEGDGTFTQYEDDGSSIENNTTEDDSYGTIDNISYGEHVSTVYSSKAAGGTATFTAEARRAATTATTPTAPRPSWPMCPPSPRALSPRTADPHSTWLRSTRRRPLTPRPPSRPGGLLLQRDPQPQPLRQRCGRHRGRAGRELQQHQDHHEPQGLRQVREDRCCCSGADA